MENIFMTENVFPSSVLHQMVCSFTDPDKYQKKLQTPAAIYLRYFMNTKQIISYELKPG